MAIAMGEDEAWAFLEAGHTAVVTTLRRDGWPVSLPLWYIVDAGAIYVATPATSKKVLRIQHDDRACVLVERGEAWVELAAVEVAVRATTLDAGAEAAKALDLFGRKYADFIPARPQMPDAATRHYDRRTVVRLDPAGPLISWDNARMRSRT